MLRRFLVLGLVLSSLLATAVGAVVVALGPHWGREARPLTEALPSSEGVFGDSTEYWSEVKGYSIELPDGWSTTPSSVDFELTSTDVFATVPSDGQAGVAPTLSVTKETIASGIEVDQYLRNWTDYLGAGPVEMSQPQPLDIAGMQGYLVDYEGSSRQRPVQLTAAVLVKGGAGWEIVLAVPEGKRSEYRPVLAAVLDSFTIR